MFFLLRIVTHRLMGLKRPGLTAGTFLIWYALARIGLRILPRDRSSGID